MDKTFYLYVKTQPRSGIQFKEILSVSGRNKTDVGRAGLFVSFFAEGGRTLQ